MNADIGRHSRWVSCNPTQLPQRKHTLRHPVQYGASRERSFVGNPQDRRYWMEHEEVLQQDMDAKKA